MIVKLLSHTQNAEKICAIAGKTCYSQDIPDDVDTSDGYLNRLHDGCFEHAVYTFAVSGVSRALTHQLVRHRVASYDQQSQRYCKIDVNEKDWYIMPESIRENTRLYMSYGALMYEIADLYNKMCESGISNEDARFLLPNACKSNIIITMNARELMHFFNLRCCNRAQWEIRELANKMLELCKDVSPDIFKYAGANCVRLGYCPEHKSCGKYRTH